MLDEMRIKLGLYVVIRISSLVYSDPATSSSLINTTGGNVGGLPFSMSTTVAQVEKIISFAKENGADLICFKPAHIHDGSSRTFVRNEPVYQYLEGRLSHQKATGENNGWSWEACRKLNEFSIMIERSPRLNRLKATYEQASTLLRRQRIFCVAPLALLFLSPLGLAACCDTWDDGLGSPALILTRTMRSCQLHYLYTLYWMLTSIGNYWPNHCVLGCGWTELNLSNPLNAWAKDILRRLDAGLLSNAELWRETAAKV